MKFVIMFRMAGKYLSEAVVCILAMNDLFSCSEGKI